MVELHGARLETLPAIHARDFSELVKQSLVVSPITALPFDVSALARSRLRTEALVE